MLNFFQRSGGEVIAKTTHLGDSPKIDTDNASILLKFENGSNAVINYFSNGSKKYSKERVEVYSLERTWIMDNYKITEAFGVKGFRTLKTKIDKGHKNQFGKFIQRIQDGGGPLIKFDEILNVTKASYAAIESLKINNWVNV